MNNNKNTKAKIQKPKLDVTVKPIETVKPKEEVKSGNFWGKMGDWVTKQVNCCIE